MERRRDHRICVERPVKLQCMTTGRYLSGSTGNLSASGALLRIDSPSLLVPGQRVRVGVAQTRQQAILRADELMDATVVRSLGHGGTQSLAVRFDHPQELAMTA